MPQEPEGVFGQARQSANWLVGLSGAFIAGALAKLDWIQKFPTSGKIVFLIASLFFFFSICAGAFYIFQSLAVERLKSEVDRAKAATPANPDAVTRATGPYEDARGKLGGYSDLTMLSFLAAGITTVGCLGCVLFLSDPPPLPKPPVPPNHFTLVTVPVQMGGRLDHDHTFLLNQQTGEMWRMTCRPDKSVEFDQVERKNVDGSIEELKPHPKSDATQPATQHAERDHP